MERTAEWGHWGITLATISNDHHGRRDYSTYQKRAYIAFPVGNRGPIDLPKREEYKATIKAWLEGGVLPRADA